MKSTLLGYKAKHLKAQHAKTSNCLCNSIYLPLCLMYYHASFYDHPRVVEGEVSDRLNGKLIIIIIIGPIHNTHIPNYTQDFTHPAVPVPDLFYA